MVAIVSSRMEEGCKRRMWVCEVSSVYCTYPAVDIYTVCEFDCLAVRKFVTYTHKHTHIHTNI